MQINPPYDDKALFRSISLNTGVHCLPYSWDILCDIQGLK